MDIVDRVRLLIADPAGASAVFADGEIKAALDEHRAEWRYRELRAVESRTLSGVVYGDYYADGGPWGSDAALVNGSFGALTPDVADPLRGHWGFTAGQAPPVYVSGSVYDLYATAADLLEAWAAKVKLEYDFGTDGQDFKRAQKGRALLAQAGEYRRRARPVSVAQVRGDLAEVK